LDELKVLVLVAATTTTTTTTTTTVDLSFFCLSSSSFSFYLWHSCLVHVLSSRLIFLASAGALGN
jgi:surface polysaccharide O-acyltransferase-like enzyme